MHKLNHAAQTLGNIRNLEHLNILCCKIIEVFPPEVAQQRSLIELNLGGTKLKEFPIAMGDLSDLEVLDIGSSEMHSLMPSLGDLKNLTNLVIRHYLLHKLIVKKVE